MPETPSEGVLFLLMFTGIITEIGRIEKHAAHELNIVASSSVLRRLKTGDSISVNGACLTVVTCRGRLLKVDVMPETWEKTTLSKLGEGEKVNLELPITAESFISGHFVQGHVDGTAKIKDIKKTHDSHFISLEAHKELSQYFVDKGSVAINGISLTIINSDKSGFSAGIIPHTWKTTTFRDAKKGELVNIEVDILAKYIEKLAKK